MGTPARVEDDSGEVLNKNRDEMKAYILMDKILLISLGSENVVTSCTLSKKELEGRPLWNDCMASKRKPIHTNIWGDP